ncbi:MAG: DMT family transporter, partial [Gammaproteobacteria bacterium]
ASRMTLGFVCVYVLTRVRGEPLRFDRTALTAYALAALGIYGAMFSTYWAAQHVPSGWISLIFGLSPLLTALLAAVLLGERTPGLHRVLAQLCGLAGLALIFYRSVDVGPLAALGTLVLVGATACHALSAVLLKRQDAGLPATTLVAGGLLVALVPYWLSFWLLGGRVPDAIPGYVLGSIVYLGAIGTTCGFTLYYFLLRRQSPSQLALVAFVAPVSALALGRILNGEAIEARVALGALLVLAALFLHEVLPALARGRAARRARAAAEAAL